MNQQKSEKMTVSEKKGVNPTEILGTNRNIIVLPDNPIDPNKPLQLYVNEQLIDESEYLINKYEGKITLINQTNLDINNIKIDYFYLGSLNSEHSIRTKHS